MQVWNMSDDPTGWRMSEKLDGIYCSATGHSRAGWLWVSVYRGPKFAKTRANRDRYCDLRSGSLHHRPARTIVDDYGTLLFVAD